jgi:hypothetical protein
MEGVYISLLSALGGVIVAYSLLYAGAIDKTISTTFSIVLTSLIEYIVILKEVPNIHVILHSLSVIISIMLYSFHKWFLFVKRGYFFLVVENNNA